MENKKLVIGIVGGSGFIGSSLANFFIKHSYKVKILDRKKPPKGLCKYVNYVYCDIRDYHMVRQALKNVNLVIHCAVVQIPSINEMKKLGYEVNIIGTQNICKAIDEHPSVNGMILAGSWHVMGESELKGVIDESFGYRPDKVEDRARLYALSKIMQEAIVRFYDEMSEKIYGVIRMGTVLGEGMPEKTAAKIFIEKGLRGESLTPYKHSMYRPMFYVDIRDVCNAFRSFSTKILNGEIKKSSSSLSHVLNVCYPEPITILELAEIIRDIIVKVSSGKVNPRIEVIDIGQPSSFVKGDEYLLKVDVSKVLSLLKLEGLRHPKETLWELVSNRLAKITS